MTGACSSYFPDRVVMARVMTMWNVTNITSKFVYLGREYDGGYEHALICVRVALKGGVCVSLSLCNAPVLHKYGSRPRAPCFCCCRVWPCLSCFRFAVCPFLLVLFCFFNVFFPADLLVSSLFQLCFWFYFLHVCLFVSLSLSSRFFFSQQMSKAKLSRIPEEEMTIKQMRRLLQLQNRDRIKDQNTNSRF